MNSGWKRDIAGLGLAAVLISEPILTRWAARAENERIKESIKRLVPLIEKALLASLEAQAHTLHQLYHRDPTAKLYINIQYKLRTLTDAGLDSPSGIELERAEIGQAPVSARDTVSSNNCFGSTKYKRLSISEEIKIGNLFGMPSS